MVQWNISTIERIWRQTETFPIHDSRYNEIFSVFSCSFLVIVSKDRTISLLESIWTRGETIFNYPAQILIVFLIPCKQDRSKQSANWLNIKLTWNMLLSSIPYFLPAVYLPRPSLSLSLSSCLSGCCAYVMFPAPFECLNLWYGYPSISLSLSPQTNASPYLALYALRV